MIVGVGALGCVVADLLVRAGVGTITLIDRDVVEHTNLQRQTLFDEQDAAGGLPKAVAAERRLRSVNSEIVIRAKVADLRGRNASSLVPADAALLIDGTDNFETRYLLNDLAVQRRLPLVYGGVVASRGLNATFLPGRACLRCVFDDPPAPGSQPTCETAGVLGPAAAMVGARQASDAIAVICGRADLATRRIWSLDLHEGTCRAMDVPAARHDCPCCARRLFEFLESDGGDETSLCGREAVQVMPRTRVHLDLAGLSTRLAAIGAVQASEHMVRARIDSVELTVFADARAIVKGTTKPEVARSVYAKYVGA